MTSQKVSRGHWAQIPLAAMVLPSEVAWAFELRVISPVRTCGQPVPGLPVTQVPAGLGSDRGRDSPGSTAHRVPDLAQAPRPVPVVFRCHPASVPFRSRHRQSRRAVKRVIARRAFGQPVYDRRCAQGLSVADPAGRVATTADKFESLEKGVTELTIPLLLRRAAAPDSGVQQTAQNTTSAPHGFELRAT